MRGRIVGFLAGVVITTMIGAAAAVAAVGIPDSAGVIHACYTSDKGLLRVVASDSECKKGEIGLQWNQRGPQGEPGEPADPAVLSALTARVAALEAALAELTGGSGGGGPADYDGDGFPDSEDNCPTTFNEGQEDFDSDGIGNACDFEADIDGDGVTDDLDNCPLHFNPGQEDVDGNGIGDICHDANDGDFDYVPDTLDNCPTVSNPDQMDRDLDLKGDACDAYPNLFDPGVSELFGTDVGECEFGLWNPDTGAIYLAEVGPVPEIDNGLDDDCDGRVDEFNWTLLGKDTGACQLGVMNADTGEILRQPVAPSAEIENYLDDDCDGTPDEDFGGLPAGFVLTGTDIGMCEPGVMNTATGQLLVNPIRPAAEVYNGLDDDCDGVIDNGVLPV